LGARQGAGDARARLGPIGRHARGAAMSDEGKPGLLGQIKDRLIRSKERTAAEGRHITGSPDRGHERRLPPGQHLVEKWPVLDLGIQPEVPLDEWRLVIDGAIEAPLTLT